MCRLPSGRVLNTGPLRAGRISMPFSMLAGMVIAPGAGASWLIPRLMHPIIQSAEGQPRPTFYDSAKTLMVRWFGNMMRTNGRAIRLSTSLIHPDLLLL